MKNIIETLNDRGLISAMTSEELTESAHKPMKVYVGFDPTSDSLHVGNLVGIMVLAHFERAGHETIAVVGGATGMIGDPSGRSAERNLLDHKTIESNLIGITKSLRTVLKSTVVVNNYDWFKGFGYIEFLRDVGKHFRLGIMLAKDSVKSRLSSEEGLSFTEFSYQTLQAYDFLHLYDTKGVTVQMGGNDQWGNITAGTELVRKVRNATVHGLTWPLLTRSDGKKFGKSEEGAIWLNDDKLAPFDFYQYFFRLPDADIINLMKKLTFMNMNEIAQIESEMKSATYVPNSAQRRLSEEMTRLIHGEEGLKSAQKITDAFRPGSAAVLDEKTLTAMSEEALTKTFPKIDVCGVKLIDLLVKCDLIASKAEARRLISNGGVYINNNKISDENYLILEQDLIESKFLLLGVGKKKKMVLKILA
jgi:tyrosyl-tRNA synthetase